MFPAKQTLRIKHIKVISNKKLVQEIVYNNLKKENCTQIILGAPGHEMEIRMALKRGFTHLTNLLNFPIVELHEWKNINDFIGELMWPTDQKGTEIKSYPLWISYKRNISRSTRGMSWYRLSNFFQMFANEYKPLKQICQRGIKDIYTKMNYGWGKGASPRMRCSWRFQIMNKPRKQHRGGHYAQTAYEIQEGNIKMISADT
jgi:hypothetical protein